MGLDYGSFKDISKKLIDKFGTSMSVVVSSTAGTYSAATDSWTRASASYTVYALFTDLIKKDEAGTVTRIKNGMILFAAKDLPRIDDNVTVKITHGSKLYIPSKIETLQPGGDAIIYKAQVA